MAFEIQKTPLKNFGKSEIRKTNIMKKSPLLCSIYIQTEQRKNYDFDSTETTLFDIDELQLRESMTNLMSLKEQLKRIMSVYVMFVSPSVKRFENII